jgi:NADH:ubiquinone oxidoreductase subunit 3 (subunit A)
MGDVIMTPSDLPASPVVILVFALATGYLIYLWSRTIAPAFTRSANKAMPYVGGEAVESQSFQPGYQFFYVALFFTVVHVAALVIATAPPDASLWATLGYLAIVAVAVMVLRWEQ